MMDWSDRHCRVFHRLLAPRSLLYTEMVTTGALLHGNVERHLGHDRCEHPLALQLGGSSPDDLAAACRIAAPYRFDEINLNCGCPSDRVQRGTFGACLMAEPERVRDCMAAMAAVCTAPVTVKCRIGIDRIEDYDFLRRFVDIVATAGVERFIIHARNAWLEGLSPKENRDIPPLRYDLVHRLAAERPDLAIVINGGIVQAHMIAEQLERVDGVMIGRAAYQQPARLPAFEAAAFGPQAEAPSLPAVVDAMGDYIEREARNGTPLAAIARHMLGLFNGLPGARNYRRILSEGMRDLRADRRLLDAAMAAVQLPAGQEAHPLLVVS